MCVVQYLAQAEVVAAQSLLVLLHLAGHHFARAEVETSQIHRVPEVAG